MSPPSHRTFESLNPHSDVKQPQSREMHALKAWHDETCPGIMSQHKREVLSAGIFFTLSHIQMLTCRYKKKRFISRCFILSAKLWIIHNTWTLREASRHFKTFSQTISSVRTRRLTVMSLSLLFTGDVSNPCVVMSCHREGSLCPVKRCSPWMCFSFFWNVAPSISIISLDAFGL